MLFAPVTTHAGINSWTATGPEGGLVQAVLLLPSQPGAALVASGDSVYRTMDSGVHWTKIVTDLANTPQRFAVDPADANRVLFTQPIAGTSAERAIYLSGDGGRTFLAHPFEADTYVGEIAFNSDGSILYG